jgi:DNA-binding XRE family transcriptional regulator
VSGRINPERQRRPNRRLQELRIQAGLSPDDLGYRAGVSGKQIRLIEAGAVIPRPRTQFALARVFDLLPLDIWPLETQRTLGARRFARTGR